MGRPREFNEQKVLEAAGEAFWTKGYEATSTRDLTACTGLTHSSIYAAFGDKRGLFLRALEHYLDRTLRKRILHFETSLAPSEAIISFFSDIVDRSLADSQHRGCLLVNTSLEASPEDAELQHFVAGETVMIEQFFQRCIIAGQQNAEIPIEIKADEHARHLLAVLLGLRVLARIRSDSGLLTDLVRPALAALGLAWPSSES